MWLRKLETWLPTSNFQHPTYIKKGNKRQKNYGMVRREEVEDCVASGICYALHIFGLIIQGTKISNISLKKIN